MSEIIRVRQTDFGISREDLIDSIFGINNGGDWVTAVDRDKQADVFRLIIDDGTKDIVIDKLSTTLAHLLIVLENEED